MGIRTLVFVILGAVISTPARAWEEHSCKDIPVRKMKIVVHSNKHANPDAHRILHVDIPSSLCAIAPAAYYDLFLDTRENAELYQLLRTAVSADARITIAYDSHQTKGWYYAITSISIVGYN